MLDFVDHRLLPGVGAGVLDMLLELLHCLVLGQVTVSRNNQLLVLHTADHLVDQTVDLTGVVTLPVAPVVDHPILIGERVLHQLAVVVHETVGVAGVIPTSWR